jgi:hypothetical protein
VLHHGVMDGRMCFPQVKKLLHYRIYTAHVHIHKCTPSCALCWSVASNTQFFLQFCWWLTSEPIIRVQFWLIFLPSSTPPFNKYHQNWCQNCN